jgi:hypothetical protein
MRCAVAAAKGRQHLAVLSPGAPRETPTQKRAAEFGLKIGTFPTGTLSPATAGVNAGLAAIAAGESAAKTALAPEELSGALGYGDYDAQAKRFINPRSSPLSTPA